MKKYFLGFFLILGCLMLILNLPTILPAISASTPIKIPPIQSPEQEQANIATNQQRASSATIGSIFINNFVVSLGTFIPIAGWSFIGIIIWNTGKVISSYHFPYWTLTSFFVWTELSVYSFAILQGVRILNLYRLRKTTNMQSGTLRIIAVTIPTMALILFISAVAEYFIINA